MTNQTDLMRQAYNTVRCAINRGDLARPHVCEICGGVTPEDHTCIVAHHWNGYDNPLDVWFICYQCNHVLKDPKYHAGTFTKSQARDLVMDLISQGRTWKHLPRPWTQAATRRQEDRNG